MTALRSALFLAWFIATSVAMSLVFCPVLILPRPAAAWLGRSWSAVTLWGLRHIAGIQTREVGPRPRGPVLVAAEHMSMWDTMALYIALRDPGTVLKRELLHVPFYGWFLWKATAIAVDRGGKARALRRMTEAAKRVLAEGRPILIFPEGTRRKPGAPPDYKPGVAALYGLLDVPCVPVALNSGRYWTGFLKKPGTITLEFLEPIPPGLARAAFMELLQNRIEGATKRLLGD